MSTLVQSINKKQTITRTENGARSYSTSLNANLDLFFMGGAFRNRSENELIALVGKAISEDKNLALKVLAYIRDARGGMGERRFFRSAIKYLANTGIDFNVSYIPELGRWDDVLELIGTSKEKEALYVIMNALGNQDGLCAKWMPRQGKVANKIRNFIGYNSHEDEDNRLTPKEYRKLLVKLTNVVETQMCNKEWNDINYSHVPSIANVKYNKAFLRNDEARRREFLGAAVKGEVKINSSVAFPDDVVYRTGVRGDWQTATAMWNQLPNYLEGSNVRFLPICDVSGSMSGRPMEISISLGMYLSERNESIFKDAFITFSRNPQLQYLTGDLQSRFNQLRTADWGMNTDLEATYRLILDTAVKNKISQAEMPTHLLIISDMEFDAATRSNDSLYKTAKKLYEAAGYELPNIVFWNVNSRQNNVPIRFNKDGVGLVSGASPAILQAVLSGNINPIDIMLRAVDTEKYEKFITKG